MIQARIQGIPCQIKVTHFESSAPYYGSADNACSDLDYYGYTEIDFAVYDIKGYPAPWLERKMSSNDRENIEELIEEQML